MIRRDSATGKRSARLTAVLFALAFAVGACDLSVVNPGPLQDVALDDRGAHEALVNGAERAIAQGLQAFAIGGAASSREVQAAGSTGFAGITIDQELGRHRIDERQGGFSATQEARWVGEHAVLRIEATMGAEGESYAPLAQAYLWAGYANRILGEHMCHAVFDGGPAEPYTVHFDRALEQLGRAAEIAARAGAVDVELAAVAGRAAAHLYLGNWTEAEADAERIPANFGHVIPYYLDNSPDYDLVKALSDHAVRGISTWNTVYERYYPETGDPRTAYGFDPNFPIGENPRTTYGDVPFYYPLKYFLPRTPEAYTDFSSRDPTAMRNLPVNLATGHEMRLIIAEVHLQRGNWQEALSIINARRAELVSEVTGQPLVPWEAASLEEAWTALKRERGIELWMEGRRQGDLRRWREAGTPGELHPLEYIPDEIVERFGVPREQDVCWPIPLGELEANPNIPVGFYDP